jgi:uncharacterized protein YggE
MKRYYTPLLTAALAIALSAPMAAAQLPTPQQPHIVVEGLGEIKKIPDLAIIRFDVVSTATNASTAKQNVDAIVGKAIAAAKHLGVAEAAIKASRINAAAQYDWNNQQRVYKGERVSRQVEMSLQDTDRYNDLIDALLAVGISQMQPPQLTFSDHRQLQHDALKLALEDARDRAQLMAGQLGEQLGRVFQIAPVNHQAGHRSMAMLAQADQGQANASLTLGRQTVEQRVRVVYLLAD